MFMTQMSLFAPTCEVPVVLLPVLVHDVVRLTSSSLLLPVVHGTPLRLSRQKQREGEEEEEEDG